MTNQTWRDLPDPRRRDGGGAVCEVDVAVRVLKKIARKHVRDRDETKSWRDWVGARLHARICGFESAPEDVDLDALEELAKFLEADCRRCLNAPLLIRSRSRIEQSAIAQRENWYLAPPSGALMVVTVDRHGARVSTCFFREGLHMLETPRRRCRALQNWLLARQFRLKDGALIAHDAETPLSVFSPDLKRGGELRLEHRYPLEFVSPENWGVDPGPPTAPRRDRVAYAYSPDPTGDATQPRRRRRLPSRFRPEVDAPREAGSPGSPFKS